MVAWFGACSTLFAFGVGKYSAFDMNKKTIVDKFPYIEQFRKIEKDFFSNVLNLHEADTTQVINTPIEIKLDN